MGEVLFEPSPPNEAIYSDYEQLSEIMASPWCEIELRLTLFIMLPPHSQIYVLCGDKCCNLPVVLNVFQMNSVPFLHSYFCERLYCAFNHVHTNIYRHSHIHIQTCSCVVQKKQHICAVNA